MTDYMNDFEKISVTADESDIIAQTPEKPRKKIKLKSKDNKHQKVVIRSDKIAHVHHDPEEFFVKARNFNLLLHDVAPLSELKIKKYKSLPYIYHSHKEVLSYADGNLPKNNNVRMLGIAKERSQMYFLSNFGEPENCVYSYVIIIFQNNQAVPKSGECIEIFGILEFQYFMAKKLPVISVSFWKKRDRNTMVDYLHCLETQKGFVPKEYQEIVKTVFDNTSYLENTSNMSALFSNYNETILADNISCLENHVDDLHKIIDSSFAFK